MKTRGRVVTAGTVVGILLFGAGFLWAGEGKEGEVIVIKEGKDTNTVVVKEADMTKAAQAALTNALAGVQVADLKIEKETAGELTFYVVSFRQDGKAAALIITANGQALKPAAVVNVGEHGVTNAGGTIVIHEAESEEDEKNEKSESK